MNSSIQVSTSANAAAPKSNTTSLESSSNQGSNEENSGFTEALASVESEQDGPEQTVTANAQDETASLDSNDYSVDGKTLPADDEAALWQALLLLQPAETAITNTAQAKFQTMDLLDSQRKPVLLPSQSNAVLLPVSEMKPDYFTTMALQGKDSAASLPTGFAANNINMQLAAAQFTPEKNEAILLNMTEQLAPIQGPTSTLSQSLAAIGLGTATQAAATQTQMAPLNLGQNAWETNLGSRLQMMVGQNIQTAEIRLDPPELGALDIKIKITNDVASVNITSAHAQVRDALETAIPRLREMFEESGVSLGDVNVQQESFTQQQNNEEEGRGNLLRSSNGAEIDDEPVSMNRQIVSDSLLDIYA